MRNLNKSLVAAALSLFLGLGSINAETPESPVKWMTMEEAQQRFADEARMIFVDVYTDWCGWCRRLDSETFSHPVIAEILNTHFYPVKLNAEQHEPIVFQDVTYENENIGQRRPTHSFAVALLQGRLSYPTVAFFDDSMQLITTIPGFRPPGSMEALLMFFVEEVYKDNPDLDEFIATFSGKIRD